MSSLVTTQNSESLETPQRIIQILPKRIHLLWDHQRQCVEKIRSWKLVAGEQCGTTQVGLANKLHARQIFWRSWIGGKVYKIWCKQRRSWVWELVKTCLGHIRTHTRRQKLAIKKESAIWSRKKDIRAGLIWCKSPVQLERKKKWCSSADEAAAQDRGTSDYIRIRWKRFKRGQTTNSKTTKSAKTLQQLFFSSKTRAKNKTKKIA